MEPHPINVKKMTQIEQLAEQTNTEIPKRQPAEYVNIKVGNKPFYIIGNEEGGYFVTIGKYRLNEEPLKKTYPEWMSREDMMDEQQVLIATADKWLMINEWDVILKIIAIFIQQQPKTN